MSDRNLSSQDVCEVLRDGIEDQSEEQGGNTLDFAANAEMKLAAYPHLAEVLGGDWLAEENGKPDGNRNLIAGWLNSPESVFLLWLQDLDDALGLLKGSTSCSTWKKIGKKIRSHHDRANSKGSLSEIAVCTFLAVSGMAFTLDNRLAAGGKNVDIRANVDDDGKPVCIEVQWLSPSDDSENGALVASTLDEAYSLDFEYEKRRIRNKIRDKMPKFTSTEITLIAFDCTGAPELGGDDRFSPIAHSLHQDHADSDIIQLTDGIIWFELRPGCKFLPMQRSSWLNPSSPHRDQRPLLEFLGLWRQL